MKEVKIIISIFSFFLLFQTSVTFSQGIGDGDNTGSGDLIFNQRIPNSIQFIKHNDSPYAILVEKYSQKLFLFSIKDNFQLLKTYNCSTGRVTGNKKESGDLKTPEGIYYFSEIKEEGELDSKYGVRAFVMDYPNRFDQVEKRNGFGIWLHATNEPNRTMLPYNTQGCVIVNNDDIMELSKYITVNRTPIIVENEINYSYPEQTTTESDRIEIFINNWIKSWKSRDINKYMQNYYKHFYSEKKNWRRWRNYKRKLFSNYSDIEVIVEDLSILKKDNNFIVNFRQKYISDQYSDYGIKRLYLYKDTEDFKIIGEEWEEAGTLAEGESGKIKSEQEKKEKAVQSLTVEGEIKDFLDNWIKSWESRDINKYMENYSKSFISQNLNLRKWRKYKDGLFEKYGRINVDIEELKISKNENDFIINFKQKYISDDFSDYGEKVLYIHKDDGKFKITGEEWEDIKPFFAKEKEGISNGR